MKQHIKVFILLALLVPAVTTAKEPARPISVDTIQVVKIAPRDERAIIKTPDGKTQIIKPGDSLGANGKIIEITVDRVVVEEKKGNEQEKIIIRLVDGKQKIERFKKTAEQAPGKLAPGAKDPKAKKKGNSFY